MGINDSKTNSFSGADKISAVIHLLHGQSCFCSTCPAARPNICFFLSRSVLSGVVASAVAASASEEGAEESECLLFVSTVSRPPDHILPAN